MSTNLPPGSRSSPGERLRAPDGHGVPRREPAQTTTFRSMATVVACLVLAVGLGIRV